MAKASAEMLVVSKAYDFVIWSSNHVAKFPRTHRFTLGDRLQIRLYTVLELLIRAKFVRERTDILREVNLELEMLRFQFRIAKDLRCLSLESAGFAARSINEIGQLVGGWIKSSSSERSPSPQRRPSGETNR